MTLINTKKPTFNSNTGVSVEVVNLRFLEPQAHDDSYAILFCLEGSLSVYIVFETVTLKPGEFVVCDLEDVFYAESEEDNLVMILQIDATVLKHTMEELSSAFIGCGKQYDIMYDNPHCEDVYDYLLAFLHIFAAHSLNSEDRCIELRDKMIDLLLRHFSMPVFAFPEDGVERSRERFREVALYIRDNNMGKITMHEVAEKLFINENYLSQFIRKSSLKSFTNLLNLYRCIKAQRLLLTTDKTVQEISDECNFSSKKYFHKYFKFFWETTPFQCRKHFRELKCRERDIRPADQSQIQRLQEEMIAKRFIEIVWGK